MHIGMRVCMTHGRAQRLLTHSILWHMYVCVCVRVSKYVWYTFETKDVYKLQILVRCVYVCVNVASHCSGPQVFTHLVQMYSFVSFVCVYIYIHTHTHNIALAHRFAHTMYTGIQACKFLCVCVCVYEICICIYIYIYTYIYIHIDTHTHTLRHLEWLTWWKCKTKTGIHANTLKYKHTCYIRLWPISWLIVCVCDSMRRAWRIM
jgi:hypothetical protein